MRTVLRVWMALLVVGCGATTPAITTAPLETPGPTAEPTPWAGGGPFPVEAFAAISDDPVPADLAAELQKVLDGAASVDAGVSATLMSARGTWSPLAWNPSTGTSTTCCSGW